MDARVDILDPVSVTQLSGLGGLGKPVGPLILILMSSVHSAGPDLSFSPLGGGGESLIGFVC